MMREICYEWTGFSAELQGDWDCPKFDTSSYGRPGSEAGDGAARRVAIELRQRWDQFVRPEVDVEGNAP
jgi:hypothetical protein